MNRRNAVKGSSKPYTAFCAFHGEIIGVFQKPVKTALELKCGAIRFYSVFIPFLWAWKMCRDGV